MSYKDIGFTACKFCKNPIKWASKNDKWYPTALDGSRHECRLNQKGEPVPRLKPHEKLNRTPLHIENEDQLLQILSDKPLV